MDTEPEIEEPKIVKRLLLLIGLILLGLLVSSCTISLQNINTHGSASDLVDDQQSVSPDFNLDLPEISPLPKLGL